MTAERADKVGAYLAKEHLQDLHQLYKVVMLLKATHRATYTTWWHSSSLKINSILMGFQMLMTWMQVCSIMIITISAMMSLSSSYEKIDTFSTRGNLEGWSRRWETLLKTVIILSKTTIKLLEESSLQVPRRSSRFQTIWRLCSSRERRVSVANQISSLEFRWALSNNLTNRADSRL